MSEKKFLTAKGLQAILTMADANGVRVHTAGFSDNAIIEIPAANELTGRIREISGSDAKYVEFEVTVNDKKKFASLGSLLRSFKTSETDENFQRPNSENDLTTLLANICGKKLKLVKITDAIAPNFNSQVFEPVTAFKYEVQA
jgi:hypothetical protein